MFYTFIVALIKSSICTFQLKYTQYPNYNIDRFNLFKYRNIRVFACISDNKEQSEWTIASIVEIHYAREDKPQRYIKIFIYLCEINIPLISRDGLHERTN
jgi:hypothetical protein